MKLADAPASHSESSYYKLEHLPSEYIMESNPGYISEWSVTENLKCPSVTLSGYNESNVSEITIKSESKMTDVKSSKGIYEDIIPDGKRELIKNRSEALMASCDSELKLWTGKQLHGGCHAVNVSLLPDRTTELRRYISMLSTMISTTGSRVRDPVIVICMLQIIKVRFMSRVKPPLFPVFYWQEWWVLTPKNIIQMSMVV